MPAALKQQQTPSQQLCEYEVTTSTTTATVCNTVSVTIDVDEANRDVTTDTQCKLFTGIRLGYSELVQGRQQVTANNSSVDYSLRLRNVLMFLLLANLSLWFIQSLDGTAFQTYNYESVFFGARNWTIMLMVCRPLSIFFRMHSAACLFEMWSYA